MPSSHTSRDFEAELRQLRAHCLAMGARCERSLRLSVDAFWSRNASDAHAIAADVKAIDREIDRDEMEIDALVLRILALRQPVAYDLRMLTTALKLVTDLERIGDESVNLAERAEEGGSAGANDLGRNDLRAMADEAQSMVRDALDAFVEGDVARAEQVLRRDDEVDALYGSVLDQTTAYMTSHPADVPAALRVIKVAKYVERVGDHATNIAEAVIFMVAGEDVRHHRTNRPPPVQ